AKARGCMACRHSIPVSDCPSVRSFLLRDSAAPRRYNPPPMHAIWNGDATVLRQERYSPNCWKMTLQVPSKDPIEAGQFCHILTDFTSEPLLRRPFSYWDVLPADGGQH